MTCSLGAAPQSLFGGGKPELIVNNRVLLKVNGKPISVMDLVKKMDLVFYREYPQYVESPEARFQFYQMGWKQVLQEFIDRELILADAEEMKMPVSNGDVRVELEQLFGPQVVVNLDRAGLTMDEAMKLLKEDIIMRRMMYMKVNAKALKQVTPQEVREAYKEYIKNYVAKDEWVYRVISIRDPDEEKLQALSQQVSVLLNQGNIPLEDLQEKVRTLDAFNPLSSVKVSEEFYHPEKEISATYHDHLVKLEPGSFSSPTQQRRGSDNIPVMRIFYLKEKKVDDYPSFQEMANRLKNERLQKIADEETARYLKQLREKFHVKDDQVQAVLNGSVELFTLKN